MTDEQIRQAGANYIVNEFEPTGVITEDRLKCFIAGAHSRDEEIKRLYNSLEHFRSIINNLRNPWKHPDELPEVGQYLFIVRLKNGNTSCCLGCFKGKDDDGYWFSNDTQDFVVKECDFLAWKDEPKTYSLPKKGGEK